MFARKIQLAALALCSAIPALAACSDAADDVDQYSDCIQICGRFKDCFDDDYDTDSCADRCEDMEHRNGTSDVDECEDCLDDQSCTGAVFNCGTECVGIVP
ncbi:MAG TPA: hypothetical protein VJR89_13580 [Polyangiales bacterium]|nr:hypothetical protein [Polyangiales bacterium]